MLEWSTLARQVTCFVVLARLAGSYWLVIAVHNEPVSGLELDTTKVDTVMN